MKKHIPNTITCCNLISGCIAIVYALHFNAQMALLFIIVGAVFDFFDGMSARLLGVSSDIGKELDSLADDVTFGVAPSAVIFAELSVLDYPTFLDGMPAVMALLPYLAFIVAAFSAVRLAKFNLDTRQTTSFIGLPTPANALFWASFIISMGDLMANLAYNVNILLLLIFLSCWILIAEVPMFALKFKEFSFAHNKIRYLFIITGIILIALFLVIDKSIAGIWMTIIWYIILSLISNRK